MAMAVLSRAKLSRVLANRIAAIDCGLNSYRAANPNYGISSSNKNGLLSGGLDISRYFFDGRLRRSLWRGRKFIGRETLFGIQELKRAEDDGKPLGSFMKMKVSGLQKANLFANHTELQRQGEVSLALQRRSFASTGVEKANGNNTEGNKETICVTFVDKDGEEKIVQVPVGMSMLEAAHQNDIELEGACEGSLACSTCHVIIMDENYYNKLQEPTDEENDMLDLAFGLTETATSLTARRHEDQ